MKYFAIKHKTENKAFTLPPKSRGYSYHEPEKLSADNQLRLFRTERSALNALTQWCRGTHKTVRQHPITIMDDYDEWNEVTPVEGRKRGDYEIVTVWCMIEGTNAVPLKHGPLMITGDYAAERARALSAFECADDPQEAVHVLIQYLEGNMTVEELEIELKDDCPMCNGTGWDTSAQVGTFVPCPAGCTQ